MTSTRETEGEGRSVPASEYDALAEAFRDYVKGASFGDDPDERGKEIADVLIGNGYSDEDVDFIARAVENGSAALTRYQATKETTDAH